MSPHTPLITEGHPPVLAQDCPVWLIAWPDRADAAVARLKAAGWREVKVVAAQRLESHVHGCCAGHRAAVEAGMEAGRYPFFVFEEDAHPTRWLRQVYLPALGDADCVRLDLSVCSWNEGSNTWETRPEWEPVNAEWVWLKNMLGSAAMGVCNQRMAAAHREAAMRGEAAGIPIDVLTNACGKEFRILGLRRPIIYQGPRFNHNAAATDVFIADEGEAPIPSLRAALAECRHPGEPVPQCVHQIWLGEKPVPEHVRPWMATVAGFHQGWDYRLWRDADLAEILPRSLLPEILEDQTQNAGLRADVLRYEILRQQGGVYFDCDFELLQPMAHLLAPGCLHYGDELPARPAIGFLASPAGFEFWGFLLRRIRRGILSSPAAWQDVVRMSGPDAFGLALRDWTGGWVETGVTLVDESTAGYATHYRHSGLAAFWQSVGYPYWYEAHTWREFSRDRYPQARAAHHWGGSWQ
jgi:Glycosyltransferase sugar-binding region containing DXD motif